MTVRIFLRGGAVLECSMTALAFDKLEAAFATWLSRTLSYSGSPGYTNGDLALDLNEVLALHLETTRAE